MHNLQFHQTIKATYSRPFHQSVTHMLSQHLMSQYMQLQITFACESHCHNLYLYLFFIFTYISYTEYPYFYCTLACLYLVTQFEVQECSRVYKWSESIGLFVHVFVWAFILANVLPFMLMWMFCRLVSYGSYTLSVVVAVVREHRFAQFNFTFCWPCISVYLCK